MLSFNAFMPWYDWKHKALPQTTSGIMWYAWLAFGVKLKSLKTHFCGQWVCSTETKSSSPIPDFILLRYIAECGLNGSNRQAQSLTIWTVATDRAFDPKPCSLAHWACSICIQEDSAWKEIGGVIMEMLVSVPQTH